MALTVLARRIETTVIGHTMHRAIVTHELRREVGTTTPVSDVTFSAKAGEIFGFLGSSGASNSTIASPSP